MWVGGSPGCRAAAGSRGQSRATHAGINALPVVKVPGLAGAVALGLDALLALLNLSPLLLAGLVALLLQLGLDAHWVRSLLLRLHRQGRGKREWEGHQGKGGTRESQCAHAHRERGQRGR